MEKEPVIAASSGFRHDLNANLLAGLRMAAFLPVTASSLRVNWAQVAALVGFQMGTKLIGDMAAAEFSGEPDLYGLPGAMFGLVLALVAAWALAALSGNSDRALTLFVGFCALAIPAELVLQLHSHTPWLRPTSYRGFGATALWQWPHYWFALAAGVGTVRLLPLTRLRRIGAVALAVALLGVSSAFVYRDAQVWRKPYDPEQRAAYEREHMALVQEDVFYQQPRLLEQALSGVKPGRKGVIDVYFVGMAGWASQDVFMKEVNAVGKLFEERFGAEGRTVRLINNPKSVAESPIASVTSLRRALRQVANAMDADEDILFLFLTSHGSQEHRFSLNFWPMNFQELTPARLREVLDEAGIKRRVLVISACYSGGFIEPLKNEHSLIITAALPDRNSFGCSNEAEFTYFGKAYFDEALRETYSFIEAFEIAKPRIADREKKSDYRPSNPQIFVGEAIRAPLAELERDLRAGRGRSKPVVPLAAVSDRYIELTTLWIPPELVEQYRQECLRNMTKVSPATYVAKEPNYYGGLTPASRHWPRLMTAWNAYADEYCNAVNSPKLYARLYAQGLRQSLDPGSLESGLRFLRTPEGKRFVAGANKASVAFSATLVEEAAPAADRAMFRFIEVQTRINQDFQRDQGAGK